MSPTAARKQPQPQSPEAWIAANTFPCPHLRARISPAQCAELRWRESASGAPWGNGYPGSDSPLRPAACDTCTIWREHAPKISAAQARRILVFGKQSAAQSNEKKATQPQARGRAGKAPTKAASPKKQAKGARARSRERQRKDVRPPARVVRLARVILAADWQDEVVPVRDIVAAYNQQAAAAGRQSIGRETVVGYLQRWGGVVLKKPRLVAGRLVVMVKGGPKLLAEARRIAGGKVG
jgi:hypothetical protein